ncbi:MAG: 50S ribosomal protein L10 [Deltaproteobacteria bacterium]|nr:50S ribosomal protein L10 [Deltaproteobacteria bacterium]
MERTQKAENIESLKGSLARAQSLVLTDFRGLTVDKDTELRARLRKAGCEYRVVKNSLLSIAIKGTPMEVIDELLVGPTGIAFHFEEPATPAKVVTDFLKDAEKLTVKGGYVDGKKLDEKGVSALSKLPGKNELRATLLATFMAAPQTFVRLTTAAHSSFMNVIRARGDALK